jgi:hypothetical protein
MDDNPVPSPRQYGHSREYILDRLRRENRVDWLRAIESGQLSCYAAAAELGWSKRRPTRSDSNPTKKRRYLIEKLIG